MQLRGDDGDRVQMALFSHALRYVPKSGEVWCEGARLHMNPLSPYYDTVEAGRYLKFALQVRRATVHCVQWYRRPSPPRAVLRAATCARRRRSQSHSPSQCPRAFIAGV